MKKQLILPCDAVFKSTLFVKFINNLIFGSVKLKWERFLTGSFFMWKKFLLFSPLLYFYEALFKLRPLIRCRVYLLKKKRKKYYKLQTPLMSLSSRWCKAISWLVLAIKTRPEFVLSQRFVLELFYINFFGKSEALNMKIISYRKIIENKGSRNFKW